MWHLHVPSDRMSKEPTPYGGQVLAIARSSELGVPTEVFFSIVHCTYANYLS